VLPPSWLELHSGDATEQLPEHLSDLGAYQNLDGRELTSKLLGYEPRYPLWSDGGQKQRALFLPEGAQLTREEDGAWSFPEGTLFLKTFAFRTAKSPKRAVPIETRILRLTDAGWQLDAYAWNDAGDEAELLDLKRGQTRAVLSDTGEAFDHAIPSRLECKQCHESSPSEVLGVNELQLAGSAPFDELRPQIEPKPEPPYADLGEHGPLTSQVIGYFVGNCVSCHNDSNGAASSFDLRPDVALGNIIGQPTASSATADGLRISPGKPEESILLLAVQGGSSLEVKDMPPLGIAVRDASAVTLLTDWVLALDSNDDP
jgi:hypothetical protein